MEASTAEHKSTGSSKRQTRAHEAKTRPAADGLIKRVGARAMTSAMNVWESYLREPVAKGLITTGAVLTESGRLILNYGKSAKQSSKVLH